MNFNDLESLRPLLFNGTQCQQGPSQTVTAGVPRINTAVASFQRLVTSLGTPKDTLQLRQMLHKTRLRVGQVVKETSAKFKRASVTDQQLGTVGSNKITDTKTANDLPSAIEEFQKVHGVVDQSMMAHSLFVPNEVLSALETDSVGTPEQFALPIKSKSQEVTLLEREIVFRQTIIKEREQGIKEIQQQIGEVNEIFKDLAVLVHEQGGMIDDISSNIESSQAGTAQATLQLAQASKIQRSYSSLALQ